MITLSLERTPRAASLSALSFICSSFSKSSFIFWISLSLLACSSFCPCARHAKKAMEKKQEVSRKPGQNTVSEHNVKTFSLVFSSHPSHFSLYSRRLLASTAVTRPFTREKKKSSSGMVDRVSTRGYVRTAYSARSSRSHTASARQPTATLPYQKGCSVCFLLLSYCVFYRHRRQNCSRWFLKA